MPGLPFECLISTEDGQGSYIGVSAFIEANKSKSFGVLRLCETCQGSLGLGNPPVGPGLGLAPTASPGQDGGPGLGWGPGQGQGWGSRLGLARSSQVLTRPTPTQTI